MKKDYTIVFVHIPKTGGTTFSDILYREYSKCYAIQGRRIHQSLSKFNQFSEVEKSKYDCITGHSSLDLVEQVINPITITFLRDPVQQVLSTYYFIKRSELNPNFQIVKNMTLEEFVNSAPDLAFDNIQTRYLSQSTVHNINTEKPIPVIDENYLTIAKKQLDNIDFVFQVEKFDEAIILLKKHFGWKRGYYFLRNKTVSRPKSSDLDPDLIEKIKKMNSYDIELFNYSLKFDEQLNQISPSRLAIFKLQNTMFQKLVKIKTSLQN